MRLGKGSQSEAPLLKTGYRPELAVSILQPNPFEFVSGATSMFSGILRRDPESIGQLLASKPTEPFAYKKLEADERACRIAWKSENEAISDLAKQNRLAGLDRDFVEEDLPDLRHCGGYMVVIADRSAP